MVDPFQDELAADAGQLGDLVAAFAACPALQQVIQGPQADLTQFFRIDWANAFYIIKTLGEFCTEVEFGVRGLFLRGSLCSRFRSNCFRLVCRQGKCCCCGCSAAQARAGGSAAATGSAAAGVIASAIAPTDAIPTAAVAAGLTGAGGAAGAGVTCTGGAALTGAAAGGADCALAA